MSDRTGIEWTDATWNPVTGCTKVSPGCDHCYAETMHERFNGKGSFATVTLAPHRLAVPLSWRKPRRVFVNSMSDLFHDDIPDEYIAQVFAVMAACPQHTFQVLTKRHARMRSLLNRFLTDRLVSAVSWDMGQGFVDDSRWPLPNVWLGVSAEDQKWADIRIPALLDTPAAVRWISAEPLLGPIDLRSVRGLDGQYGHAGSHLGVGTEACPIERHHHHDERCEFPLDWVVVGGESGPGARPMHPDWARSIRNQCTAARVPFLFKQWGAWAPNGKRGLGDNDRELCVGARDERGFKEVISRVGKGRAGRVLDGRTWDAYPAAAP